MRHVGGGQRLPYAGHSHFQLSPQQTKLTHHMSALDPSEKHDTSVKTYFRRGGHYYWQDAQGEIQEDT